MTIKAFDIVGYLNQPIIENIPTGIICKQIKDKWIARYGAIPTLQGSGNTPDKAMTNLHRKFVKKMRAEK